MWATSNKAYVFAVTRRVEERERREVPVHRGVRISWWVLLAYDRIRPNAPEPRERRSSQEVFATLHAFFGEGY